MKTITGERVNISIIDKVTYEHIHRYLLAKNYVENKIVLDIACGTGYGSFFLSHHALKVVGIDINEEVINENKTKYIKRNLDFLVGQIDNIPIEDNSIDVVVSFETIEHVHNAKKTLSEIKRVLKKNGLLIISTPNKFFSDKYQIKNPFHIKEYDVDEFKNLILEYFQYQNVFFQIANFNSLIIPENLEVNNVNLENVDKHSLSNEVIKRDNNENWFKEYIIVVASDEAINVSNNIEILNSNECYVHLANHIKKIYNSTNYRVGYVMTYPIKLIMHLLNIKKYPDILS